MLKQHLRSRTELTAPSIASSAFFCAHRVSHGSRSPRNKISEKRCTSSGLRCRRISGRSCRCAIAHQSPHRCADADRDHAHALSVANCSGVLHPVAVELGAELFALTRSTETLEVGRPTLVRSFA